MYLGPFYCVYHMCYVHFIHFSTQFKLYTIMVYISGFWVCAHGHDPSIYHYLVLKLKLFSMFRSPVVCGIVCSFYHFYFFSSLHPKTSPFTLSFVLIVSCIPFYFVCSKINTCEQCAGVGRDKKIFVYSFFYSIVYRFGIQLMKHTA